MYARTRNVGGTRNVGWTVLSGPSTEGQVRMLRWLRLTLAVVSVMAPGIPSLQSALSSSAGNASMSSVPYIEPMSLTTTWIFRSSQRKVNTSSVRISRSDQRHAIKKAPVRSRLPASRTSGSYNGTKVSSVQPSQGTSTQVVTVTGYCLTSRMANGEHTWEAAARGVRPAALKGVAMGTTVTVLAGRLAGTVVTVLDRPGHDVLDVWFDTCGAAINQGREEGVSVEITVP